MKELLIINILIIFFIAGCLPRAESKPDVLNDGRRLERNKDRMSSEYKIKPTSNSGPIIFIYANDGFYPIRATSLSLNKDNKYQRYFFDTEIRTNGKQRMLIENIEKELTELSFEEFCEKHLIKAGESYYKLKKMEEYYAKLKDFRRVHNDDIWEVLAFERENLPDSKEIMKLYFSAQYYYDFLIYIYNYLDVRLYPFYLSKAICPEK